VTSSWFSFLNYSNVVRLILNYIVDGIPYIQLLLGIFFLRSALV